MAESKLAGPEFPESVRYLSDILNDVHGRSGFGPMSVAPVTIDTLMQYQSASGTLLSWLEMRGLMYLDGVKISASLPAPTTQQPTRAPMSVAEMRRGKRAR